MLASLLVCPHADRRMLCLPLGWTAAHTFSVARWYWIYELQCTAAWISACEWYASSTLARVIYACACCGHWRVREKKKKKGADTTKETPTPSNLHHRRLPRCKLVHTDYACVHCNQRCNTSYYVQPAKCHGVYGRVHQLNAKGNRKRRAR